MKTLKQLLTRPLRALPSSLVIAILVIALIGFADATYLSVEHFLGVIPPCSITGGCEKVLTSVYAVVLGVPVSLIGSVYYLLIAIGSFILLESKHVAKLEKHNSEILRLSLFLTIPGFLASLWFTAVQIFIIHSYCAYCLGSAILTTVLFILTLVVFRKFGGHRIDSQIK
jgi:uncharacterized membrane protein